MAGEIALFLTILSLSGLQILSNSCYGFPQPISEIFNFRKCRM